MARGRIVRILAPEDGTAMTWWNALLQCSPRAVAAGCCTAAIGGLTSLLAAGMSGLSGDGLVHVAAPKSSRPLPALPGVRMHETRRWRDEDIVSDPIPRVRTPMAAVQAALWARTDREAALLLIAPVQQRLTTAPEIGEALQVVRRDRRRSLMRAVVGELVDGVHSLNELDFARLCRARGLPEPSRQVGGTDDERTGLPRRALGSVARRGRDRRHRSPRRSASGWTTTIRHNEIALTGRSAAPHPVSLGLRLDPDRWLDPSNAPCASPAGVPDSRPSSPASPTASEVRVAPTTATSDAALSRG